MMVMIELQMLPRQLNLFFTSFCWNLVKKREERRKKLIIKSFELSFICFDKVLFFQLNLYSKLEKFIETHSSSHCYYCYHFASFGRKRFACNLMQLQKKKNKKLLHYWKKKAKLLEEGIKCEFNARKSESSMLWAWPNRINISIGVGEMYYLVCFTFSYCTNIRFYKLLLLFPGFVGIFVVAWISTLAHSRCQYLSSGCSLCFLSHQYIY